VKERYIIAIYWHGRFSAHGFGVVWPIHNRALANRPCSEWGKIFSDQAVTFAAIDRLVHNTMILEMNLESYRRSARSNARTWNPASSSNDPTKNSEDFYQWDGLRYSCAAHAKVAATIASQFAGAAKVNPVRNTTAYPAENRSGSALGQ
jgi:hypothetical protein